MRKKKKTFHDDQVAKQVTKAQQAALQRGAEYFERARANASDAAVLEVEGMNNLRLAGLQYQEAAGHEQVTLAFYRRVIEDLPKGMTFHALKACVHVARNYPDKIKTLNEARAARQLMFVAFGEIETRRREIPQTAHDHNPWNDFVSTAASFTTLFQKLEEQPMEQWEPEKLDGFIRETLPIVEKHEAAKRLAAGGVR